MLISVCGELDLATCGQLAPLAEQAVSARRPVILDLTECSFIDSSGLHQVLRISGLAGAMDRRAPTAIVSPSGSFTSQLFALAGVDKHLKLFGTGEDAIAWLETHPQLDDGPNRPIDPPVS